MANDIWAKELRKRVIEDMEKQLNYAKMLYRLTNHSKKKEDHFKRIKFWESVIDSTKREYGMCENEHE